MSNTPFNPCENYKKLKKLSDIRKESLFGEIAYTLNYRALLKKMSNLNIECNLHHYIPRYRMKDKPSSERDAASNILILSIEEHVMAHYYLTKFETNNFKYSAQMAFIQMCNLNKNSCLDFSEEELALLVEQQSNVKSEYFGSERHIEGSRKAGKAAGLIRKQQWAENASFREEILKSLHSESSKKKRVASRIKTTENSPPWYTNGRELRNSKYKDQLWEYFDTIYISFIEYNLSYKIISKIIGVPHERISNIVRTIKEKYADTALPFSQFRFYDEYLLKFQPTFYKYKNLVEYYSELTEVPWNKDDGHNTPWLIFDKYFQSLVSAMNQGYAVSHQAFSKFYGKNTSLCLSIHKEAERLYINGYREMKDIPWYNSWCVFMSLQSADIKEIENTRYGIYSKNNMYHVSGYNPETNKVLLVGKYQSFKDACLAKDSYEMARNGCIVDIRHFTKGKYEIV